MSLINRIWDVWTNTAQEELLQMIDEFRTDYVLEERFISTFGLLEDSILEEDYERARLLFEKHAPMLMSHLDRSLFYELLDEAEYGY